MKRRLHLAGDESIIVNVPQPENADRPAVERVVIEVTDPPAWLGSKWKPSHGGVQDIDAGIYWERNPEIDRQWQRVLTRPLSPRRRRTLDAILNDRRTTSHG